MRKILFLSYLFLALFNSVYSQINKQLKDLTVYVNPFTGTGGHGHTYPGASMPFGMIQLSPDTRLSGWDGCSGYHYSDSLIYGFTHTHLSGTGCIDYGDILIMPTTGAINLKNKDYASSFKHQNEKASPGFYSVFLEKYKIAVELTCTKRAGFHKYTFPNGNQSNILVDLKHRDQVLESWIEISGKNEIRGLRRSKEWAENQTLYFVIQFSKPFESANLYQNDEPVKNAKKSEGKNTKASFTFSTYEKEPVLVKIGISAVSIEGAVKNLNAEISDWDFEQIKKTAKNEWNKELNKIVVEGGTNEQMVNFYTALYHSFLNPNLYIDVDGNYRGRDNKIHETTNFDYYTVFSLWDTYRALHPLLTIIDQKRTNDFINTFITQYEQGGLLPVWELSANETFCMIGYHAVPVIADAYLKGINKYDTLKAYNACISSASRNHYGLDLYRKYNHVIADFEHESVSKTLEYAYDDWCIAQMALRIDDREDYANFIRRAQYYKNVFDASTGFMRAKLNGMWYSPFEPTEVNNNFTEANSWQYSFYVPHDLSTYIEMHKGKKSFLNKLDEMFTTSSKVTGREQSDITGLIGQYAHGNEPSHHAAYLFVYAGAPWKTQERVHQIMKEMYHTKPDGLCGNEDCGQMSAWYVLSAMGFYPVCPGTNQYAIGTPLFEKITINLENGKQFIIKAKNVNEKNFYIKNSATLMNGKTYTNWYINHNDMMRGGEISFEMQNTPDLSVIDDNLLPSTQIKDFQIQPVPFMVAQNRTFVKSQKVEIKVPNNARIFYTLDGSNPDTSSALYSKPFEIDKTITIKAFAINNQKIASPVIESQFFKLPEGISIELLSNFDKQYTAGGKEGLIDQIRGGKNFRLGGWQGYRNIDFSAVVKLNSLKELKKIGLSCLQDIKSWIWFPKTVQILISDDGKNYTELYSIKNMVADNDYTVQIKNFICEKPIKAQYIKIIATTYGKIPDWHEGAGDKSWTFVDEIIIE